VTWETPVTVRRVTAERMIASQGRNPPQLAILAVGRIVERPAVS